MPFNWTCSQSTANNKRLIDFKMAYVLCLSVLLHLSLGYLLLVRKNVLPEPAQTVAVEFRERSLPSGSQVRSKSGKSRATKIPLSKLVPRLAMNSSSQSDWTRDTRDEDFRQGLTWTDSRAYDQGELSSAEGLSAAQSKFIKSIWRMIDQYIEENPFLSEYNHTGKVFLRFEVDEKGRLLSLQASAMDRVLKVIATRAVRKALRNETGDVHFPDRRMALHARFSWAGYQACNSLRGHQASFLSFCHYAENKRKSFSSGEKTAVWTGAIINHGPWAYEEIKKYRREESRRKSQFNPFRKYELDPDWNL